MSGKIKIVFAVLALGAFASLYQLLKLVSPNSSSTMGASAVAALQVGSDVCSRDSDGDGLPDCQETFWNTDWQNKDTDGDGFLDGEEVISGHNPAKKGPNDFLDSSKNITERTKVLLVGGIMTGELDPTNPNYADAAQKLADAIVSDYEKNSAITIDNLNLVGDSPEEKNKYTMDILWIMKGYIIPAVDDLQKFLTSVQDLPSDDATPLTDNAPRLNAFITLARSLANSSGNRALKIAAFPVPRAFSIQHKNAIKIMRILQRQYEIAATIKSDPLQGMTALRAITTVGTTSIPNVLANLAEVIQ